MEKRTLIRSLVGWGIALGIIVSFNLSGCGDSGKKNPTASVSQTAPKAGIAAKKAGKGGAKKKNKKVDICHRKGQGNFTLINVSTNAQPAHLAHGDVLLEDAPPTGCTNSSTI